MIICHFYAIRAIHGVATRRDHKYLEARRASFRYEMVSFAIPPETEIWNGARVWVPSKKKFTASGGVSRTGIHKDFQVQIPLSCIDFSSQPNVVTRQITVKGVKTSVHLKNPIPTAVGEHIILSGAFEIESEDRSVLAPQEVIDVVWLDGSLAPADSSTPVRPNQVQNNVPTPGGIVRDAAGQWRKPERIFFPNTTVPMVYLCDRA